MIPHTKTEVEDAICVINPNSSKARENGADISTNIGEYMVCALAFLYFDSVSDEEISSERQNAHDILLDVINYHNEHKKFTFLDSEQ